MQAIRKGTSIAIAALALVCLCMALCACAGKASLTGFWSATAITYTPASAGTEAPVSEMEILVAGEDVCTVMLEEDGSAILELEGEVYDGGWKATSDGFRFTGPEWEIDFKVQGDAASADILGMQVELEHLKDA